MKIALLAVRSSDPIDQLYLEYLSKSTELLVSAGHQVWVLSLGNESDLNLPESVSEVSVDIPDDLDLSCYRCREHAYADSFNQKMLELDANESIDVLEIPLWGGIGVSVIRSKRLLNLLTDTKIVVNAWLGRSVFEGENGILGDCFATEAICSEMEQYCLRYADIVYTPFDAVKTQINLKAGRSDTKVSGGSEWFNLSECSGNSVINSLSSLLSEAIEGQQASSFDPLQSIYGSEGKKRYVRKADDPTISILATVGSDTNDESLQQLTELASSMEVQLLAYVTGSDSETICGKCETLGVNVLNKADPEMPLSALLEQCNGDFLVFWRNGLELNQAYLKSAVKALGMNSEISAIGCYAEGSRLKYPVGSVSPLLFLSNTLLQCGNVFRLSKLKGVSEVLQSDGWKMDDWPLLVSLVSKYQSVDLLPYTGVKFAFSDDQYQAFLGRARIVDILNVAERGWKGSAVKLVKYLVGSEYALSYVQLADGIECSQLSIPLVLAEPEVQKVVKHEDPEPEPKPSESGVTSFGSIVANLTNDDVDELESNQDSVSSELQVDSDSHSNDISSIPTDEIIGDLPDRFEKEKSAVDDEITFDSGISTKEVDQHGDGLAGISISNEISSVSSALIDEVENNTLIEGGSDEDLLILSDSDLVKDEPLKLEEVPSEEATISEGHFQDPRDEVKSKIKEHPEVADEVEFEDTRDHDCGEASHGDESQPNYGNIPFDAMMPSINEKEAKVEKVTNNDPLDWVQVFWSDGLPFSEEQSEAVSYDSTSSELVEVQIMAETPVQSLRIDPSNRKGLVRLKRIEVWNNETHLPIFNASEENAFEYLNPTGDIEIEGIEQDALLIRSTGSDPQILINLEDIQPSKLMVSVEFTFERNSD